MSTPAMQAPLPDAGGPGASLGPAVAAAPPAAPTSGTSVGLAGRTWRGSAWAMGGHAAGQLIRFANNLALTYLIAPQLLGLMGVVHAVLAGLHQMSDFGVGPALIRDRRGDEQRFRDTAWTLHVIRGGVICLLTLPLGQLLALLYAGHPGAEQLAWLVPAVGTTALIAGLHSTAVYSLNRHLNLRPIVVLDVCAQLAGCSVGLIWAYLAPDLHALVAAVLVHQAVHTLGSHCLGTRNRLHWDRVVAADVARFGRWIWVSTTLTWMTHQIDRLVMPAMLHFDGLAVYQVALLLAGALPEAVHLLGARVLFPALSDVARRQEGGFAASLRRARLVMVLPAVGALLVLSLSSGWLIRCLYPDHFADAGWMLRLLAIAAIPQVLTATSSHAFLALGQSFVPMCLQSIKLLLKGVAMVLGHELAGADGVVMGLAAAEVAHYPVVALVLARHGLFQPRLDVPVVLGSAAVIGIATSAW